MEHTKYSSERWLRGNVLVITIIHVIIVSANAMWLMYFPLYLSTYISAVTIGYVFSFSLLLRTIGYIIGGPMADKFGRKKAILLGLFISVLGITLIFVIIQNLLSPMVGFLIYCIGCGIGVPGTSILLMESAPKKKKGISYMFATYIAPSIPPAGLVIVARYLFDIGFYLICVLIGVICFALSMVIATLYLKETLRVENSGLTFKPYLSKAMLKDSFLVILIISFGLQFLSSQAVTWYIPLYLKILGYKAFRYGILVAMSTLAAALGGFISGKLTDSLGPINACTIGWFSAATAATLFALSLPYTFLLLLYTMWMLTGAISRAAPPVLISDKYMPTERATKLVALNFFTVLVSIAGPFAASLTLFLAPNTPFMLRSILLLGSIATLRLISKSKKQNQKNKL